MTAETKSADAGSDIESLIRTTSRLVAIMRRESELLNGMRVREVDALQKEKAALAASYETAVRALAAQPAALQAIAPALREELLAAARLFDQATAENLRRLAAARTAHDRLIKAIVDAVTEQRNARNSYAATGAPAHLRIAPNAISITLDRRL